MDNGSLPLTHYQNRSVFAKQVDDIWTADLVDMSPYSRSNSGYKYLLTVIDVFSKYGWIVPLKTKTGMEVAMAFQQLFTDDTLPSRLWMDKGTEFYNQHVKRVLAASNVTVYSTENEEKSSVVERWNRTMKYIMWKYFTANNTQKYIDLLPGMVEKYNSTYHQSIKLKPTNARKPAYYNAQKASPPRFHIGDKVRIVRKKGTFEKGFTPNWTEVVFTITTVKATKPPTYTIEDHRGLSVQGSFYEQELQTSVQEIYRIERVLKRGKYRVFVKWKGYGSARYHWPTSSSYEHRQTVCLAIR